MGEQDTDMGSDTLDGEGKIGPETVSGIGELETDSRSDGTGEADKEMKGGWATSK